MKLTETFSKFLKGERLTKYHRSDFRTDEHFGLYYLLYKIDYHRRLLGKIKAYSKVYQNDKDMLKDHQDIVINMQVKIIELEGMVIKLFEDLRLRNTVGNLNEVFKTALDLPLTMPERIESKPIIMLETDNVEDLWALIEEDLERTKKSA